MQIREVQTCLRCRESKRRCDKTKPICSRCYQAGVACIYDSPPRSDVSPATTSFVLDQTGDLDPLNLDSLLTAPIGSRITANANAKHEPERIVKRRDRACFSCTRCHRLKVKCDKKSPSCRRCAQSGYERTCIYTHKAKMPSESQHPISTVFLAGENPETVVTTWFLRRRGYSHWRALISRASPSSSGLVEIRLTCLQVETLSGLGSTPFDMAVKE
jgi:hypothetical protein